MVNFAQIAARLRLGGLLREPERVSGGYMHRMYRLDAESGSYALKLLNPEIMKRPDARANYARAERLEKQLEAAHMPVVTALEFGGQKMQHSGGRDFYLFPWVEGKALKPAEVTPAHCAIMGDLLALQHSLPCDGSPSSCEAQPTDWRGLLSEARVRQSAEMIRLLEDHLALLEETEQQRVQAAARLKPQVCISNGDMDIKNVLWQEGRPLIIDLECLDYGHPEREMLMLALMWAGWETGSWKIDNLRAFAEAYVARRGKPQNDILTLYDSMDTWPAWLEYNVKRAIGLEAQDGEEQQLGQKQAAFAMERILLSREIRGDVAAAFE